MALSSNESNPHELFDSTSAQGFFSPPSSTESISTLTQMTERENGFLCCETERSGGALTQSDRGSHSSTDETRGDSLPSSARSDDQAPENESTATFQDMLSKPDRQEHSIKVTPGKEDQKKKSRALVKVQEAFETYNSWWWWEISGMTFSFCGLIAAAVLLGVFHNRPLSSWTFPIAPNSLLSVFATVSKTALLLTVSGCISQLKWLSFRHSPRSLSDIQVFDEASRGPWGSFTFLLTLRLSSLWKHDLGITLTALGTFATIAALAIDPFTQQILQFPSKQSILTSNVTLPVTKTLDNGEVLQLYSSPGCNASDGFFTHNNGSQSTGTCKFDFSTNVDLDAHSNVVNGIFSISPPESSIKYGCATGDCTWPNLSSLGVCSKCINLTSTTNVYCSKLDFPGIMSCTFKTPSNMTLFQSYSKLENGDKEELFSFFGESFLNTQNRAPDALGRIALLNQGEGGIWKNGNISVFECNLSLCVRAINATVEKNHLNETYLPQSSELVEKKTFGLRPFGYSDDRYQTFKISANDSAFSTSPDDLFIISAATKINIGFAIEEVFTTNSSTVIGDFLFSQDPNQLMESVALYLTAYIRQLPNNTMANGQGYLTEPFIEVRWAWSLYLVLILVMALALLTLTIVFNARRRMQLWKANNMALVFSHVRNVDESSLRPANIRELERTSHRIKAQLSRENIRGLEFVAQTASTRKDG